MKIYINNQSHHYKYVNQLIKKWNLIHDNNSSQKLIIKNTDLEIVLNKFKNLGSLKIDFFSKTNMYRCNLASIKKERIAKAIGIKYNYFPNVLDATAGLGQDAYILAFLGCTVTLMERNPIIAMILESAISKKLKNKNHAVFWKPLKRMNLIHDSSFNMLNLKIKTPDVIYLDPMYPKRTIKSLPKKSIQLLQKIVGNDYDSNILLEMSKKLAKHRVVVKRFINSPYLNNSQPNWTIMSKKHRFDIYLPLSKYIS